MQLICSLVCISSMVFDPFLYFVGRLQIAIISNLCLLIGNFYSFFPAKPTFLNNQVCLLRFKTHIYIFA